MIVVGQALQLAADGSGPAEHPGASLPHEQDWPALDQNINRTMTINELHDPRDEQAYPSWSGVEWSGWDHV
jgi:hypothetical protein